MRSARYARMIRRNDEENEEEKRASDESEVENETGFVRDAVLLAVHAGAALIHCRRCGKRIERIDISSLRIAITVIIGTVNLEENGCKAILLSH